MTFEKGLKRLEELVARLERGDLGLDASLKAFEEGVKLVRFMSARIDEAEQRVEVLVSEAGGVTETVPFDDGGDSDISEEPGDPD